MVATKTLALVPKTNDNDTWDSFIGRVGERISHIEAQGDAASWEKAQIIIDADDEANKRPEMRGKNLWEIRRLVTQSLRDWWLARNLPHPRKSFFSNARKLYDVWPDTMVSFKTNHLPYQHYRQMAVSSLPPDQKQQLRDWAESERPTQQALRQRIREQVDAMSGVYLPDFDLKKSNHWLFKNEKRADGFDGGVNYELFANLIHLYSDPGDTVIDPFAGGGILGHTLARYRHFQSVTKAEHSGPRFPLMSDIAPTNDAIHQADVRVELPWDDDVASLGILDPPYWRMSEKKYSGLGESVEEWKESIRDALVNTARCVKSGGKIAIMTDDFVRKTRHEPLGLHVLGLILQIGLMPYATIYNFNRNFIGMSPIEMSRSIKHRLEVNAVKIIQVAEKP